MVLSRAWGGCGGRAARQRGACRRVFTMLERGSPDAAIIAAISSAPPRLRDARSMVVGALDSLDAPATIAYATSAALRLRFATVGLLSSEGRRPRRRRIVRSWCRRGE